MWRHLGTSIKIKFLSSFFPDISIYFANSPFLAVPINWSSMALIWSEADIFLLALVVFLSQKTVGWQKSLWSRSLIRFVSLPRKVFEFDSIEKWGEAFPTKQGCQIVNFTKFICPNCANYIIMIIINIINYNALLKYQPHFSRIHINRAMKGQLKKYSFEIWQCNHWPGWFGLLAFFGGSNNSAERKFGIV